MKKIVLMLTVALVMTFLSSCGVSKSNVESSKGDTSMETSSQNNKQVIQKCNLNDDNFDIYRSNTYIATGNNYIVEDAQEITYRAYFPIEEYGELEYCFYFSNTVDSTYSDGELAYVGLSGGEYKITSAYIANGGKSTSDEITNRTPVTFNDGSSTRDVAPDEAFWSDAAKLNINEGEYLVWEWTITGSNIPCIYMSSLTSTTSSIDGGDFSYCDQIPLPQLIGAKRDVTYSVAAIGDSITQGCQTDFMAYEFWAAKIANQLSEKNSFWNCGLGWSRTSDAAQYGNWLGRTETADVVIVAFGTNDIISGEYGGDGGNSPEEIIDYLKMILDELVASDCKVILFNAPPENYDETLEAVRLEYNDLVKKLADEQGVYFFDFASYLSDPSDASIALYGGHPNGEGGTIVADAFIEQFSTLLDVK